MIKNENGKKGVNLDQYWKDYRNAFIFLVIITAFTLLSFFLTYNSGLTTILKLFTIIVGIVVIFRAGKFAYWATGNPMAKFTGLWLLLPIPLLNFWVVYSSMKAIKKSYLSESETSNKK